MGMTCAFSGHRPEKLPWGSNELDPRCTALKIQMEKEILALQARGIDWFLCGMARGTDLMFAQLVVELKKTRPLTLEAVLPCRAQERQWDPKEQLRFRWLLDRCDEITCLEDAYSQGCMLRRNRYMVDRADVLLTVFDGNGKSGTGSTVAYARQQGREIVPLWR